jgi:hypothetical protein
MSSLDLLALCRAYEKRFPYVPDDWFHLKQYALPIGFRNSLKNVWSFGVSKEIRFEEGIKKHNPNAKIYTWDPTPIALSTANNSRAKPIHTPKAYDPSEQDMVFYTVDPEKKCWSLENYDPENLVDKMYVKTENLTTIKNRLGTDVDLIKLDIEGRWFELCNEIIDLDLPVKMVHVEFEMYFGSPEEEFLKLDSIVKIYRDKGFKVYTNRLLSEPMIELCFDRHE